MRSLGGITDSMDMSLDKLRVIVKNREDWHAEVHVVQRAGHDLATDQPQFILYAYNSLLSSFQPNDKENFIDTLLTQIFTDICNTLITFSLLCWLFKVFHHDV